MFWERKKSATDFAPQEPLTSTVVEPAESEPEGEEEAVYEVKVTFDGETHRAITLEVSCWHLPQNGYFQFCHPDGETSTYIDRNAVLSVTGVDAEDDEDC